MWQDPNPEQPLPFLKTVWLDAIEYQEPAPTLRGRALQLLNAARRSGFRCALTHRMAYTARARLGAPGRVISGGLFWWGRHFYNCAITPTARIHGGLCLPHPTGISIGPDVVIGPQTWIFQNVSLVAAPTKAGMPRVGKNCALFVGAVVTGPVRLGDGVHVGANAVVARNVESGVLVTAPPARDASMALLGRVPPRAQTNGAE